MRHYNIKVKGKVHGVAFRFSTHAKAIKLGLTGLVKNMPDGSVYIEAEEWCYVGPPRAKVSEVDATESEIKGYRTFELKRL
jgi:acylphosphatase